VVPPREAPIISNAGEEEGVDLASLVPANREHMQERAASLRASASRTSDKKREHKPPAPRTREQLLALRVWTPEEYEASLRQSRQKGWPTTTSAPLSSGTTRPWLASPMNASSRPGSPTLGILWPSCSRLRIV